MNQIVYKLTDSVVAYRETPHNVCFDFNKSINIKIEGQTDNFILAIRVKGQEKIQTIKINEEGIFNIPTSLFLPNSTILLDLAEYDENDKIIRSWILEPINIVNFEDKQSEIFNALQDYSFLQKHVRELENKQSELISQHIDLIQKNNELEKRISEVEKLFATLTEVMV